MRVGLSAGWRCRLHMRACLSMAAIHSSSVEVSLVQTGPPMEDLAAGCVYDGIAGTAPGWGVTNGRLQPHYRCGDQDVRRSFFRHDPQSCSSSVPARRKNRPSRPHLPEDPISSPAGECDWPAEGKTYDLGPGDVIWTSVGCIHSFENVGDEPMRWFWTQAPFHRPEKPSASKDWAVMPRRSEQPPIIRGGRTMRNLTWIELDRRSYRRYGEAQGRAKGFTASLVRHLHAFIREVNLTSGVACRHSVPHRCRTEV